VSVADMYYDNTTGPSFMLVPKQTDVWQTDRTVVK